MDAVSEIKARLPIEQLVGEYCQLKKKGRGYVSLCPFHTDTHPSFQISPDKGIAYCFACRTGGDIFSFYQAIEGVNFPEAIAALAEKVGVEIRDIPVTQSETKDRKERLRSCNAAAWKFYQAMLSRSLPAMHYLQSRSITDTDIENFGLGYAPDSFSETYTHLLKEGFSKGEIIDAGLAIQQDLREGKTYDRFRNRIMFPIHDAQGRLVAFGGRTIGSDDAKYINSSEGALYQKSSVLFGLHRAKEALREKNAAIVVEGYFDVLACHRVGVTNVVGVCGTALTEAHGQLLKRWVETVTLCFDQDSAGKAAAERSFSLLNAIGLQVHAVTLKGKDPDEMAKTDPELLRQLLTDGGVPYIDLVLEELQSGDLQSAAGKHNALQRLIPLLRTFVSSVVRSHYLKRIATFLSTTETALLDDLGKGELMHADKDASKHHRQSEFTPTEVCLGLFLLYPESRNLLLELIEPEEPFAKALYMAIKESSSQENGEAAIPSLAPEWQERMGILKLYCEHHRFFDWSPSLVYREIKAHCMRANRELLQAKQRDLAKMLREARVSGKEAEEVKIQTQYNQVLKLAKMVR